MTSATQKLMRSRTNRMLAGVAGGIAQYMALDPVIVRLVFVALALSGVGLLLYPLLWLIMPNEPSGQSAAGPAPQYARATYASYDPSEAGQDIPIHNLDESENATATDIRTRRNRLLGLILVGVGAFLILTKMLPWVAPFIIPAVLVAGGIVLLRRAS